MDTVQIRQIKNNSTSASPSNAAGPGQHDNRADSPPPLTQANFVVDVVANLLAGRADAAAILAAVTSRIAPLSEPSQARSPQQPDEQPDMQPASANASPPTVKVLGERTHAQRDAELRKDAFDLSSISSSIASGSSFTPTVKQSMACSPALFTASTVLDAFKTSPSNAVIGQVLRAPFDFTTKDWRVRNFYDASAVVAYARWSQPEGQPHRDASDALAELSDPEVLAVPADLRHSNPDIAASAWDQYRRHFIHSLHRAFAAGVDWLRALRAMSLVYSDPMDGHPRINQYIESAMTDRALVVHPLLHADVLIFKLDTSFASGSKLYSKDSRSADWERTTSRLPGEDVITCATRVTEAFVKKVSDPEINTITVWNTSIYAYQIHERFVACLFDDPSGPPERGPDTAQRFIFFWNKMQQQIAQGQLDSSALNIIEIALSELEPHESSRIQFYTDVDDDTSQEGAPSDSRRRYTTTGRGARSRRAEKRLSLAAPPPQ
jgi:hypothetical protein